MDCLVETEELWQQKGGVNFSMKECICAAQLMLVDVWVSCLNWSITDLLTRVSIVDVTDGDGNYHRKIRFAEETFQSGNISSSRRRRWWMDASGDWQSHDEMLQHWKETSMVSSCRWEDLYWRISLLLPINHSKARLLNPVSVQFLDTQLWSCRVNPIPSLYELCVFFEQLTTRIFTEWFISLRRSAWINWKSLVK